MASLDQSQGMYNVGVHPLKQPRSRVSTTLWEDENTLCFQVEARGISVARREDNDMINGTKLLNVAGMTRGRRDGMLKAEKDRHVVKIGAMHLKGVWIPFDRAAAFAQKEGIADILYPLFVEDIRSFLFRTPNNGGEIPLATDASKPPYHPAHPQMHQMQHAAGNPAVQASMQHQLTGNRQDLSSQMISGIPDQSGAKPPQGAGRGDEQQGAQQAQRQQYPYVPQYSMQGYGAPMGSANYPAPYASSYTSYPQLVYGNQEYNASQQQAMYYQGYQGYDQNQVAQAYQQQQQQQQQQPQQPQQQQQQQQPQIAITQGQQHYYQAQPQQAKPHGSPKEEAPEAK